MKFKTSSLTFFLMLPLPLGDSGGWLSLWGSGVEGGAPQLLPLLRRLSAGVKVRPPGGAALRGGVA